MRVFLLIVALSVLPAWGFAAGDLDTSVDAYIHREMTNQRIPALALAVIQHGRIVKMSAYGHANVEFSVPATVKTNGTEISPRRI